MVVRKIRLLANGSSLPLDQAPFEVPRFEEVHGTATRLMKRLGYFILVEIIRAYVRVVQFFKNKYLQIQTKMEERRARHGAVPALPKEPNRFLKVMAEYKRKIGRIKKEVKEEENL